MNKNQKEGREETPSIRRFILPSALRAAPPGTGSMKRRIEQARRLDRLKQRAGTWMVLDKGSLINILHLGFELTQLQGY